MNNFDVARRALETSEGAEGSANIELEKQMQSIEAKINQLKAAWEGFSQAFLGDGVIKFIIDSGVTILSTLTKIVDTLGTIPTLAVAIAGAFAFKNKGATFTPLLTSMLPGDIGSKISGFNSNFTYGASFNESLKTDQQALLNYVRAIDEGANKTAAFNTTMANASFTAKEFAQNNEMGFFAVTRFSNEQKMAAVSTIAQNKSLTNCKGLIKEYNTNCKNAGLSQSQFANAIGQSNPALARYLNGLNGAKGSLVGYVGSLVKATAKQMAMRAGMMALEMATTMLVSFGISLLIKGLDSLVHAQSNASKAADELKEKLMNESEASLEEYNNLDDLIKKYKELAQSGLYNSEKRTQAKEIQEQIVDLVGSQAKGIDLVNGKLDEQIDKLTTISAKQAETAKNDAVQAYVAAKDSYDKAMPSVGLGIFELSHVDYAGQIEKEIYDVLNSNENFSKYLSVSDESNNVTGYKYYINTSKLPVIERIKTLQEMASAIKQNYENYSASDTYNGIIKAIKNYQSYMDDVDVATNSLLQSSVLVATRNKDLSKIDINSVETFKEYKDKLFELVKGDTDLKAAFDNGFITDESVKEQINNYLGSLSQYSDYFNELSKIEEQTRKNNEIKISFMKPSSDGENLDTSLQKAKELNEWFDKLSDEDKEAVYKIVCETDTATYSLEDWQKALEKYKSQSHQTIESINSTLKGAVESQQNFATGIKSVQDILGNQKGGQSVSPADFSSEELKDYQSALEYVNGAMQLNAEKTREITKAKTEEKIAINNTNKINAQARYIENAREIERYRKELKSEAGAQEELRKQIEDKITALQNENDEISAACQQYDLLNTSLQEATDSYRNWLNAQNSADYGDMENDAVAAIQRIRDTYTTGTDVAGDFGSKKFDAAIDFIVPENVDPDDLDSIKKYMVDFQKYLSLDDNGKVLGLDTEKFLKDAVDAGLMKYTEDDGFTILGGKKMEDFAKGLNLSSGTVQAFFDELQLKGGEFDWADETTKTIGDLAIAANEATDSLLKKFGDTYKLKLDVSDIDNVDGQLLALDGTIKEVTDIRAKFGVDTSEYKEATSILEYCITQKQLLCQPDIMKVNTDLVSQTNGELGNALSLLQQFKTIQDQIELKKTIGLNFEAEEDDLALVMKKLQELNPTLKYNLKLDTTSEEGIAATINGILSKDFLINLGIDTKAFDTYNPSEQKVDYVANVDKLPIEFTDLSRTVNYYANTKGLDTYLAPLTRYVYYKTPPATSSAKNAADYGLQRLNGTANANGNWGAKHSGKTLVGELGREIVVDPHTGKWYTVGDNGAEFVDIPASAIVFNHIQTESLLENGYVSGRAHALVSGTALVTGKKKGDYATDNTFGGKSNNTTTTNKNNTTNNNNNKKNNTTFKNNNSSSSNSDDSKEDKLEKVDWIEIAISRIERAVNKLKKVAESTFKSLKTRSNAISKEITKVTQEISTQKKAYDRYIKEANAVGLNSKLASKVRDGTININEYDSETQELIKDYQGWYEKALACQDAVDDLHESLASLYEDDFNNIQEDFDNQISLLEHLTSNYESGASRLEAIGRFNSTTYYDALNNVEENKIATLNKELTSLTQSFNKAMASGEIEKYSSSWYSMQQAINETKEAINDATLSILENNKAMRELEWSYFDYIQERISQITQESDFLIELMSNSDLYTDNGQLEKNGLATMGLRAQNYNVYMAQADKYAQEILKLDKEIAKDPYNTDLIARREELLKLQQESIASAEEEKQAIVDLVSEGIELELESLKKLIDAYNDSLDSSKDLYEYQKKVSEQTKNIANLQKQLSAYENDGSEETRMKIQQIKVDLEEAQNELEETEYDKFVSDTKELLDNLYTEYEEILNERLDNVELLITDMIEQVNANSSLINQTLITESDKVGYTLSDAIRNVWAGEGSAVAVASKYGDNFTSQLTSVNEVLNAILVNVSRIIAEGDKRADDVVGNKTPSKPPNNSNNSNNKNDKSNSKNNQTSTKKKFSEDIKRGVAAAIWVYGGAASGWGDDPQRKKRLTEKFGAANAKAIQDYINAHGKNGDLFNYWVSTKRSNLSNYYYKAFKQGGLADYTGIAWLDGTPSKPEAVLNAKDTENFMALRDTLQAMAQKTVSIKKTSSEKFGNFVHGNLTDVSSILSQISQREMVTDNNIGDITINIPIDHVEDYEDFITKLQHDKKFEDMLLSMTVDRVAGKSSLSKYKYNWRK